MKVRDILDRVRLMYHDMEYRRITKQQYLSVLDDAILATINFRPDSHEKRVNIKLDQGARQRIPSDGYTLIDVYANRTYIKDLDKWADGKPVYQVSRKDLDYFSNWYIQPKDITEVNEFAFDVRTPKDFWVNPPLGVNSTVYVEIAYSYKHPSLVGMMVQDHRAFDEVLEVDLEIPNEFQNALVEYCCYKLFATDATSERDMQIAAQYYQMFQSSLKGEYQTSVMANARIIEPTQEGLGIHTDTPPTEQQRLS